MMSEEPESYVLKSHQLLSEAQSLMRDLNEMPHWFSFNPSSHRGMECQVTTEDGTLVIEDITFESAAKEEELRRLNPHA